MSTDAILRPSGTAALLRALSGDPRAALGLGLVALASAAALGAPLIAPYPPDMPDFINILAPPSSGHWLGTDELGRDVLSRIIYGAQTSLFVGILSVAVAAVAGTALGLISGYFGRWVDALIMRIMDVVFAFPSILLALAITAVLGPSLNNAVLAIAVVNLPVFARIARAQTLVVRELEFVEAKRALGFGTRQYPAAHHLAEYPGAGDRAGLAAVRFRHHHRILSLFSRVGCAAADGDMGQHAAQRDRLHGAGALAGSVSRRRDLPHRTRLQSAGRWAARPLRPARLMISTKFQTGDET